MHFDENSTVVNKNLVPDSRPEVLKKSVEDSLQRLQMNHLDLYYIHRVDPTIPIEETAGVMKELIDQGKITHWGISEATRESLEEQESGGTESLFYDVQKFCPDSTVLKKVQGFSWLFLHWQMVF